MNCIDVCPVKGALILKPVLTKKKLNKKYAAGIAIVIFLLATGIAMLTGNWQNDIAKEEYLMHFKNIEKLNHFTGTGSVKNFNDSTAIKNNRD